MSRILNVDELLECAKGAGVPDYEIHLDNLEASASLLANAIASRLGIRVGPAEFLVGFGGLCASFNSDYEGQPIPKELEPFDKDGDWD